MADIVVRACVRSRTSLLVGERKRACECVSTRKCLVERDEGGGLAVVVDERFAGSVTSTPGLTLRPKSSLFSGRDDDKKKA